MFADEVNLELTQIEIPRGHVSSVAIASVVFGAQHRCALGRLGFPVGLDGSTRRDGLRLGASGPGPCPASQRSPIVLDGVMLEEQIVQIGGPEGPFPNEVQEIGE